MSPQSDTVKSACFALFSKFGKEVASLFIKRLFKQLADVIRVIVPYFSSGVRQNKAVQRRVAGVLLVVCSFAPPQHRGSGHEGLLSCPGGMIFLKINAVL